MPAMFDVDGGQCPPYEDVIDGTLPTSPVGWVKSVISVVHPCSEETNG